MKAAASGDYREVPVGVSGVRSGLDVLGLLALGARGVLIGRAWVYALGARGGAGVAHILNLLAAEMKVAIALSGKTDIKSIGSDPAASLRTQCVRP
jgi:L-lactate dehydrogenase (cytochrome)